MSLTAETQAALAGIRQSLAANRLAHAYLVLGNPRGQAGQFANELLALLYCSATGDRPCRECSGCRRIAQRVHPDLIWVEPQKKSRTIQTDQAQEIQQFIYQTSLEGGWKTVVLVHAERLNEVAANKLLKTLEEPPAKCLFLLLSSQPEFLPATIVSRCQRVILAGDLAEGEAELKAAVLAIVTGGGAPGAIGGTIRAQRMLALFKALKEAAQTEQAAEAESEMLATLGPADEAAGRSRADIDPALRKNLEDAIESRIEGNYRERRTAAIRWLLGWCRDVLLCVSEAQPEAFCFPEAAAQVRAAARPWPTSARWRK
jgi:DNA polymerase-3 subunit delta'